MTVTLSQQLQTVLTTAGVRATCDPNHVTPPCVLITPPQREYDLGCGYSAVYKIIALAPAPGGLDAARHLDELTDGVAGVVGIDRVEPIAYEVPGQASYPAYLITLDPIGVNP